MAKQKTRLDLILLERHPHLSRNYVQSLIMQGKVRVEDTVVTKAGTLIPTDAQIFVDSQEPKYVSRAGFKLEKALDHFNIDVTNLVALDAGLSTGGFTDCLLQRGIQKVYGVDVGYGQVHEKIRSNPKVIVMERTNLRYLTALPEKLDLVTLDLSFISVLKVIESLLPFMKPQAKLIVLIKPQFEAERHEVGKGGIVTSQETHEKVITKVITGITQAGFTCHGYIQSPILGAEGNKEFLAYFEKIE
jgi:23S rRNA (cytidine1920-2'-O)/16S rRNA (cytidine1409-2'-O)-methyltransferase